MRHQFKFVVVILILALQIPSGIIGQPIANSRSTSINIPQKPVSLSSFNQQQQNGELFSNLPLIFELNQGQADDSVKFITRGRGYNLLLRTNDAILAFANPTDTEQHFLRMKLLNSILTANVVGVGKLPGKVNYFIGNDPDQWHTNIPTYSKVKCIDVYRGIDMVYYSVQGALEYDFVVRPGADPKQIAMSIEGADEMKVDVSGDLIVKIPDQEIHFHAPRIYQDLNGTRQMISGAFILQNNHQFAFDLSAYDKKLPLIIDPQVVYATYLGGSGSGSSGGSFGGDIGSKVAVDAQGSAYITGQTFSVNFPLKTPIQGRHAGNADAFVTKLSPDGSSIVYSTFLGGSFGDAAVGIALNAAKSAFVTGNTGSFDFPLKNPMQNAKGGADAFVAKLSPTGSSLVYSTYLGGTGFDSVIGIEIGKGKGVANSAYIFGATDSTNFPLVGATQKNFGGGLNDGFISVLNPAGSKLIFSTYIGDKREEQIVGCAINTQAGDLYLTLKVDDSSKGTQEPYLAHFKRGTPGGSGTIHEASFWDNLEIETLRFLAFYGFKDAAARLKWLTNPPPPDPALDAGQAAAGELYISMENCVAAAGSQECHDVGFVATLDSDLNLKRATNFGGDSQKVFISDHAVDSQGRSYVVGTVESTAFRTVNPIQPSFKGGISDGFIIATGRAGSQLVFASYIGGDKEDVAQGVAVDPQSNIYVSGYTASTNFLQTPGAFQTKKNGPLYDSFIVKISPVN